MTNAQPDDLAQRFTYHAPTPEQPEVYQLLRDAAYHLALLVQAASKPSREQSLAMTKVEEAVMHANSAIARHGLADPAYAGAADLHDQVLTQLATERPGTALVGHDTDEHWHVDTKGVPGAYSDASGPELERFYTALGLPTNMGAGAYTIEMMGPAVIIRGLSLLTDVETYSAATRHAANPDEHEPPVARLYCQADLDAAREHAKADTIAALQRAATEPLREPLSRIGVQVPVGTTAEEVVGHARLLGATLSEHGMGTISLGEDPWAEAPSYLMLELALRKVRDDLSTTHERPLLTPSAIVEYIDRVLANDLGGPETTEAPRLICGEQVAHLRVPATCDMPSDHQGPHHAWWQDSHGEQTVTWERA